MKDKSFLFEIGTEELPAKSLKKLSLALCDHLKQTFTKAEFKFADARAFATPRRLAVLFNKMSIEQPEQRIIRIGPNLQAAFDKDQKPTPAALGFARSCGVPFEKLQQKETDKGLCLYFENTAPGKTLQELLPTLLQQAISQLPIPKPMRWGNSLASFLRPVQWLTILLDNEPIEIELFGQKSSGYTYGHHFLHPEKIKLKHTNDYEKVLEKAFVIADFEKRKTEIKKNIELEADTLNGKVLIEDALLDEVTALVEYPVVMTASFQKEFLQLPPEPLISAMTHHQKCFPIVEKNNEKQLLPYFIFVSNLKSKDPKQVIHGNERVMHARLSDAAFFYQTDCAHSIDYFLEKLKHITFQAKLGSIFDKAIRLSLLSEKIAEKINTDAQVAKRAGLLAKFDLASDMVGEFPELQGIMGSYYALHSSENKTVAEAICDHYLPRFAGDRLPSANIAQAVALADKIDTLVAIFGLGQKPTGDKDPYGLRRAAIGIIRILIEQKISLDLRAVLVFSISQFDAFSNAVFADLKTFILERAQNWFGEKNSEDAWIAASHSIDDEKVIFCLFDIYQRAIAIQNFRNSQHAESLIAANKRVKNILSKTEEKTLNSINETLLTEKAEKDLFNAVIKQQQKTKDFVSQKQYIEILQSLSELRPIIDKFFDDVMVMVDDNNIRLNRLALLKQLRQLFLQVADVSLLVG